MSKPFQSLYRRLPELRRSIIEARVAGMLARMDGKPMDSCPIPYGDGECSSRERAAWMDGWGEEDQLTLGGWPTHKEPKEQS